MVKCFGISAVEMHGKGHWFTLDHQVQIKNSFHLVGLQRICGTKCKILHLPPMKEIWVPRCFRMAREREREGGGNRNGG